MKTMKQADRWILNYYNQEHHRPIPSLSSETKQWDAWLRDQGSSLHLRCDSLGLPAFDRSEDFDLEWEDVEDKLYLLSHGDRKILRLLLQRGKTQQEVGQSLGMSQPAVSYRYLRAIQKLKARARVPAMTDHQFRKGLEGYFDTSLVNILSSFKETGSQSVSSENLDLTQGRVRYTVMKAIVKLSSVSNIDPSVKTHLEILQALFKRTFLEHRQQ